MKTFLRAAGPVFCLMLAPSLFAQWDPFPTRNVPRNAAGQPDLTGPAPRTPDGRVDLDGIWQNGRGGGGGGAAGQRGAAAAAGAPAAGQRGAPAAAAPPAAGAPAAAPGGGRGAPNAAGGGGRGNTGGAAAPTLPPGTTADGQIPAASFGNAGSGFPGGLPYQPWAAELVAKRRADNSKDNPDAHCLPMGFMQFHTHPQPRKILHTADVTLIIYEANSGLRQIFTDGRAIPKDPQPWWYGYSVGKWDGDTFVVTTKGFLDTDPLWLDVQGSPLTEAATVTERFRRPNFGTLEIEVTVDDPKAYTKPWTVKVTQRLLLDTELIEFICEERDATHYVGAQK